MTYLLTFLFAFALGVIWGRCPDDPWRDFQGMDGDD